MHHGKGYTFSEVPSIGHGWRQDTRRKKATGLCQNCSYPIPLQKTLRTINFQKLYRDRRMQWQDNAFLNKKAIKGKKEGHMALCIYLLFQNGSQLALQHERRPF